MNFLIDKLILQHRSIGIRLTSGMMQPHASNLWTPYSNILKPVILNWGRLAKTDIIDYARRRQLPVGTIRRFLQSSLLKQ